MKIYKSVDELNLILKSRGDKKIVFTNGVFDLIHSGHIELLEYAKSQGDILIVGVNTDSSVRRLKGKARPLCPLDERLGILEAVLFVDYLIPFDEDTPFELINNLYRVNILVKGGDYESNEIVGRERVERDGGKVLVFRFKSDISTSKIIQKIQNQS